MSEPNRPLGIAMLILAALIYGASQLALYMILSGKWVQDGRVVLPGLWR